MRTAFFVVAMLPATALLIYLVVDLRRSLRKPPMDEPKKSTAERSLQAEYDATVASHHLADLRAETMKRMRDITGR